MSGLTINRLAILAATSGHSGVDRNLKNLIPEFASQGISVDVLHIQGHGPHIEAMPNVRVIELGTRHVNGSLSAVTRYLQQERPQALLSDKDRVNRLALWARRRAQVPTRIAVRLGTHVSSNLASRGWMERQMQTFSIRRFYPTADLVVVPSEGVADDLVNLGHLSRDHIVVIPNPVLTPQLAQRAKEDIDEPWLSEGVPVIISAGELSPRKDFEMLLRAFALLRKEVPCRLIILGEGKERERLSALAIELGVEKDVKLPGFVENPFAYMYRAAVFANSSRWEGFANVVAEALAVGTPVVSTDCPSGPREILDNGRLGKLVRVGDDAGMAEALRETLSSPPSRQQLRDAAGIYRVETVAAAYLDALLPNRNS